MQVETIATITRASKGKLYIAASPIKSGGVDDADALSPFSERLNFTRSIVRASRVVLSGKEGRRDLHRALRFLIAQQGQEAGKKVDTGITKAIDWYTVHCD